MESKVQTFKLYQVLMNGGHFKVFEMSGSRSQVLDRFAKQVLRLVDCVSWHIISEDKETIKLSAYDNMDCRVDFVIVKGEE